MMGHHGEAMMTEPLLRRPVYIIMRANPIKEKLHNDVPKSCVGVMTMPVTAKKCQQL